MFDWERERFLNGSSSLFVISIWNPIQSELYIRIISQYTKINNLRNQLTWTQISGSSPFKLSASWIAPLHSSNLPALLNEAADISHNLTNTSVALEFDSTVGPWGESSKEIKLSDGLGTVSFERPEVETFRDRAKRILINKLTTVRIKE